MNIHCVQCGAQQVQVEFEVPLSGSMYPARHLSGGLCPKGHDGWPARATGRTIPMTSEEELRSEI
jgi:hypothetical protein